MNDKGAIWLFGAVIGGAVLLAVAGDAASGLCNGVDLKTLNEGRPVFSCPEFWFQRYQALFAQLITVLVAGIGLWPVFRQFRLQNRQHHAATVGRIQADLAKLSAEYETCQRLGRFIGRAGVLNAELGKAPPSEMLGILKRRNLELNEDISTYRKTQAELSINSYIAADIFESRMSVFESMDWLMHDITLFFHCARSDVVSGNLLADGRFFAQGETLNYLKNTSDSQKKLDNALWEHLNLLQRRSAELTASAIRSAVIATADS